MDITEHTKQYDIHYTRPTPNPPDLDALQFIQKAHSGQVIYSSLIAAETLQEALSWLAGQEPDGYDVVKAEAVFGFRGELPHNWVGE